MPNSPSRVRQRNPDAPIAVSQAVQDFLASAEVKRLNTKTQREYIYVLEVFAEWCQSHSLSQDRKTGTWMAIPPREKHDPIALQRIDNQVVYCFLEHLKVTHVPSKTSHTELSQSTLVLYIKDIKRFLNWCMLDEQYCRYVLAATVKRIQKPILEEKILETFSDEQIVALQAACRKEESEHLEKRDFALICLLLDTGVRATELVTLQIGHTYLEAKASDKRPDPHIWVHGKRYKDREIGMGETTRRVVQAYIREFRLPTITHNLQTHLSKLPPREQQRVKREAIDEALLFVNRAGRPITKSGLGQIIARLGEWAEIEGVRCSPHTFRHTFAVRFMENNNNDIYALSRLLGHTSVKVTENYLRSYRQASARRDKKSAVDSL